MKTVSRNGVATKGEDVIETTLTDTEANLHAFLSGIPESAFMMEPDGTVLMINETAAARLGKRPEDIVGSSIYRFIPEEVGRSRKAQADQVVASGEPAYFTDERLDRTIYNSVQPVLDAEGKVIRLAIYGMDITDQKRLEARLQEREETHRSLFNNAAIGMFRMDIAANRPVDVNEKGARQFGYTSREDFLSHYVPSDHYADLRTRESLLAALRETGRVDGVRMEYRRLDGSRFWGEYSGFLHPDGRTADGFIADITDQLSAENALRESELKLRLVTDTIRDVFWMSTQGVSRMVYISPAYEHLWGQSRESLYENPRSFLEAVHEDDLDDYLSILDRYHRHGQAYECTYRIMAEKGSIRWIHERGYPVEELLEGERLMAGVCTDITVQVESEDTLRRNEANLKRLTDEQEHTLDLLHRLSRTGSKEELIDVLTDFLRAWLDVEAVGVRLRDGDDYPYYETSGFPESFVIAENRLCARDLKGQLIRDELGNPVLDCMCGNIIGGRFDPSLPFFTDRGSFWTNSTSELLSSTTAEDRQARTRNRCHGEGYESVALIPLKVGDGPLGLLQLNDRRPGRFTESLVALLERIATDVSMLLGKLSSDESLEQSRLKLEEANVALKVLLERRQSETRELKDRLLSGIETLVLPYLEKMEKSGAGKSTLAYLDVLRSNISELTSPMVDKVHSLRQILTPAELQIADLIRNGKTSKEIAQLLGTSLNAVTVHRYHIRKKLGLLNKGVNLSSYLQSA